MSFEKLLVTREAILHLRSQPSYTDFMKKWQIEVYFRLRSSKIISAFDSGASSTDKQAEGQDVSLFLNASRSLISCIESCWQIDVHLHCLSHRFWKLTSDLIGKYRSWLENTTPASNSDDQDESEGRKSVSTPVPSGEHQQVLMQCLHFYNDVKIIGKKVCGGF
jgi:hypothetical protein